MSFRNRLTLFFVLIVVVPMVAVAFVLFGLIANNEEGKAGAELAKAQLVARNLALIEIRERASRVAVEVAADVPLATALRDDDETAIRVRVEELRQREGATRIVIVRGSRILADVGDPDATLPVTRRLVSSDGGRDVARLQVSVVRAGTYAQRVRTLTGLDVVVRRGTDALASTGPAVDARDLPAGQGDVEADGQEYRAASFDTTGFQGQPLRVTLLQAKSAETTEASRSRLLAGGILLGFFILAFTFAVMVSRSLQRQMQAFLDAARRLGSGDFKATVPINGRDEFAALGDEFNKMSRQLETRLDELRLERERLREAMARIGETFASKLDRDRLLTIVVRTAVDGVSADGGRASLRRAGSELLEQVAAAGSYDGVQAAIRAAEHEVVESAHPVELMLDGVTALAHPIREREGAGPVAGVVSVARDGKRFTSAERELFHYLAGQAAVSIDNVDMHETIERQAVTDELTGLSNRRRFEEALESEVERFRRFGQPVGLVMLDIDNFKSVNDTHGHQQGDVVLQEVARVLRETSREVDEPARYGGEELAVVLPGTDLEGAVNLAERVRHGIEQIEISASGNGHAVRITASLGVATLPGAGYDARSLVEAADDALYRAKRLGKNRTERNP
jgi:diguanylate cyclase (GGDEF)-like protein